MCPDEYILAAFIDQCLSLEERNKLESHLDLCPDCLEKIFFLQKSLGRENAFLHSQKKNPLTHLLQFSFLNDAFLILKRLGKIEARELSLAFRDTHLTEKALLITLSHSASLILRLHEDSLLLSSSAPFALTVTDPQTQRILFAGTLNDTPLSLPPLKSLELQTNNETYLLEMPSV